MKGPVPPGGQRGVILGVSAEKQQQQQPGNTRPFHTMRSWPANESLARLCRRATWLAVLLKTKQNFLHNLSPLNHRCRLSGRREPHLAANFAPVLSAKKITSARQADNNRAAKKVLVVTSTWEGSKLANKLIPPPTALRIRAFCCGLHWLKTAVGG